MLICIIVYKSKLDMCCHHSESHEHLAQGNITSDQSNKCKKVICKKRN